MKTFKNYIQESLIKSHAKNNIKDDEINWIDLGIKDDNGKKVLWSDKPLSKYSDNEDPYRKKYTMEEFLKILDKHKDQIPSPMDLENLYAVTLPEKITDGKLILTSDKTGNSIEFLDTPDGKNSERLIYLNNKNAIFLNRYSWSPMGISKKYAHIRLVKRV